jgi:hypothetical protein
MDTPGRNRLFRFIMSLNEGQMLYIESYQIFQGGYNEFTNTYGQRKNYFILYNRNKNIVPVIPVETNTQIQNTNYILRIPINRLLNPTTPEVIYRITLLNNNTYRHLYTRRVRTF